MSSLSWNSSVAIDWRTSFTIISFPYLFLAISFCIYFMQYDMRYQFYMPLYCFVDEIHANNNSTLEVHSVSLSPHFSLLFVQRCHMISFTAFDRRGNYALYQKAIQNKHLTQYHRQYHINLFHPSHPEYAHLVQEG